MNQILSMREKRANLWDAAKKYRDTHIGEDGTMSAEDAITYDRMVEDVDRMKREIERLERQQVIDAELNQPTARPLAGKPMQPSGEEKTGRATDDYRNAFWKAMRNKTIHPEVYNSLQVGSDSEGGYLVPDEYERTLIEALLDKNIFRRLAHVIHTSSGERKIPVAVSKGTAAWIDEEAAYPESDDSFGQVSIGAFKLATMIKISEELLNDSVFNMPAYISKEFARRIGAAEEEAFFTGNGTGKPLGILAATGGAHLMTFHPMGEHSSSEHVHGEPWLDFNMIQSGHSRGKYNYEMIHADYALTPPKPVVDGEPGYEQHPDSFNPQNGYLDEVDVRQSAYWSVLTGACGHTYGNHSIWGFWDRDDQTAGFQRAHFCVDWRQALDAPGAAQMAHLKNRMLCHDLLSARPAPELVREQMGGALYIPVLRGAGFLLAYTAQGLPIELNAGALTGALSASWYDPRTGEARAIGGFDGRAPLRFVPPTGGRGQDWVLVLTNDK